MKYLFFDFDGVFHGKKENKDLFCHSKIISNALLPYKDNFKIIISSSWRETYAFDVIKNAFDEPINDLVIDITPIHLDNLKDKSRLLEILEYCELNHINNDDWIAIDDDINLFSKKCKQLILVNGDIGITSKELLSIVEFIKTPELKPAFKI